MAASTFNNVTCSGSDACKTASIYCGVPDPQSGPSISIPSGFTTADFSGSIKSCHFHFEEGSCPDEGRVQCYHSIESCTLTAIGSSDAFKNSEFECLLSASSSRCSMHCGTASACGSGGSSGSKFSCFAGDCQCTGKCNVLNRNMQRTPTPSLSALNGVTTDSPNRVVTDSPTTVPVGSPVKASPVAQIPMEDTITEIPSYSPTLNPTESIQSTQNGMNPTLSRSPPTAMSTNIPTAYPTSIPTAFPTSFPVSTTSTTESTSTTSTTPGI